MDWYLARADLARLLPNFALAPGVGRPPGFGPAGWRVRAGGRRLIWLVLWPRPPARLRRAVLSALRVEGVLDGELYAPPGLCISPALAQLPLRLHPWTPPHLCGRPPLVPGWQEAAGRLSPARIAVLAHLDRFGYSTARQLERLQGRPRVRLLAALEAAGRVRRCVRPAGPAVWSATTAGLRAAGAVGAAVAAHPVALRHSLALVDLARVLEAETGGRWRTERELRTVYAGFASGLPPPDGGLDLPDGRRVLVQLELSRAKPDQLLAFASRHHAAGTCAGIWYVCVPQLGLWYGRMLSHDPRCRVLTWTPPAPGGVGPAPCRT